MLEEATLWCSDARWYEKEEEVKKPVVSSHFQCKTARSDRSLDYSKSSPCHGAEIHPGFNQHRIFFLFAPATIKYLKKKPTRDKRFLKQWKSTFGFFFFFSTCRLSESPVRGRNEARWSDWAEERPVGAGRPSPVRFYWAGGLLGSGRLLARYLARMLEVYCRRKDTLVV